MAELGGTQIVAALLTDDEIVRWLRIFRYDKARVRVPIKAFADYIGVSRQTLYMVMSTKVSVTDQVRARVSMGVAEVLKGLRFVRVNQVWTPTLPLGKVASYVSPIAEEHGDGHPDVALPQSKLPKRI